MCYIYVRVYTFMPANTHTHTHAHINRTNRTNMLIEIYDLRRQQ